MLGESRLVYGRRKVSALRKVRAQLLFVTAFVLTVNLSAMAETIPLPRERPELIPGDRQLKAGTDAEPSPCQLRLADLAAFKRSPSITGPGECTASDVVTVDAVLLDRATVLAVGEMSRANPLWGAPHIHGELLKLGFEVAQSTVARYMCRLSLLKNLFGLGICLPATQPGPVFLPGPGRIATHSLRRFSRSDYRLLAGGVLDDGRVAGPPNPLGAPMPVVVRAGW
jgi:hypothetical protein